MRPCFALESTAREKHCIRASAWYLHVFVMSNNLVHAHAAQKTFAVGTSWSRFTSEKWQAVSPQLQVKCIFLFCINCEGPQGTSSPYCPHPASPGLPHLLMGPGLHFSSTRGHQSLLKDTGTCCRFVCLQFSRNHACAWPWTLLNWTLICGLSSQLDLGPYFVAIPARAPRSHWRILTPPRKVHDLQIPQQQPAQKSCSGAAHRGRGAPRCAPYKVWIKKP